MNKAEITAKTLVILNEAGGDTELTLLSEDTLRVSDYIGKSIPEAVRLVQMLSPSRCVNPKNGNPQVSLVHDKERGRGSFSVPTDYVSLIGVQLKSWKSVCVSADTMSSDAYLRQCNSFTKSGVNSPVCILGHNDDGVKSIFLYPCSESDTLTMFVYESRFEDGDNLPDDISLAVCYMTASVVYTIFENKASAEAMQQLAVACIAKN